MRQTSTLKDECDRQYQPRKETVDFILNYSKALEVKKLDQGVEFTMIQN